MRLIMVIKLVNLMSLNQLRNKYFHILPSICWQADRENTGLWFAWLCFGLFIGIKNNRNKPV